jgi:hypothetical protein
MRATQSDAGDGPPLASGTVRQFVGDGHLMLNSIVDIQASTGSAGRS